MKSEIDEIIEILFTVKEDWLAQHDEEILEPDLPIIDPHHHLWDRFSRYLFDELRSDVASGHNVRATVFLQCNAMYRADAEPHLAPVGETEFVNGIAAMSASGLYGPARLCAGIVGYADLRLGSAVEKVLEAHLRASDRFRGIRQIAVWDADKTIKTTRGEAPRGLLLDAKVREGFSRLAPLDLSFETWLYHPQIPELADLASAFPRTRIVLDHLGGPVGIGVYADHRKEVFEEWRRNIRELAQRPNVSIKLGGLGMHVFGFGFDRAERPASSTQLAVAWRPYVETCIEAFGVERCMFESNFPPDKQSGGYTELWNAFKRITSGASATEKQALYSGTAAKVYRLTAP
jgi:predicted TIM-barrel fold metal-dependent hydrolase